MFTTPPFQFLLRNSFDGIHYLIVFSFSRFFEILDLLQRKSLLPTKNNNFINKRFESRLQYRNFIPLHFQENQGKITILDFIFSTTTSTIRTKFQIP